MGGRIPAVRRRAPEDLRPRFADPDKGAPGTSLSMMQGAKLKEISAKASGKTPKSRFGQRRRSAPGPSDDPES